MGLIINMCNDVEKYEESVMGGFNLKKTLYILSAVLVGAAVMAVLYFVLHVNIILSAYLMILFIVPIILKGFYGQGRGSFIQNIKGFFVKKKPLMYCSTETIFAKTVEQKEIQGGKKNATKRKKRKDRNQ